MIRKNIRPLLPVYDRSTGGGKVKSGSIDEQKAQACATSDQLKSLARLCEFERPNLAIHSRRVGFCRGRDENERAFIERNRPHPRKSGTQICRPHFPMLLSYMSSPKHRVWPRLSPNLHYSSSNHKRPSPRSHLV